MAYDEALATRLRDRLAGAPGLSEKKMFGRLVFLTEGSMTVGVHGHDLMVRVGPDGADAALRRPGTRPAEMGERPMRGWILVDAEMLDDDVLATWLTEARTFVGTLPGK